MDISIAHQWSVVGDRPLSRTHKRQPRFRKLKLRGVEALHAQAVAELLQCVASHNLRATPFVDEPSDANAQLAPRSRAFGFQPNEPRSVDRFEREAELEAFRRARVYGSSGFEHPPASGIGLVALEAHGLSLGANSPAHAARTA
jgi:hypothetical protein